MNLHDLNKKREYVICQECSLRKLKKQCEKLATDMGSGRIKELWYCKSCIAKGEEK
jgi:hypothetical protein